MSGHRLTSLADPTAAQDSATKNYVDGSVASVNAALAGKARRSVYDVRDYGAVGDGSTDDTAAFQAAADACDVTGGEIFAREGTYIISQVTLSSWTVVRGVGFGTRLKLKNNANTTMFLTRDTIASPTFYPQQHQFHDLYFDLNKANNTTKASAIESHKNRNLLVENCSFVNYMGDCIRLDGSVGNNIQPRIINNQFDFGDRTDGVGINIQSGCYDSLLADNDVGRSWRGIIVANGGDGNHTLKTNWTWGNADAGTYLYQSHNVLISGSTQDQNFADGLVIDGCDNVHIINNKASNNSFRDVSNIFGFGVIGTTNVSSGIRVQNASTNIYVHGIFSNPNGGQKYGLVSQDGSEVYLDPNSTFTGQLSGDVSREDTATVESFSQPIDGDVVLNDDLSVAGTISASQDVVTALPVPADPDTIAGLTFWAKADAITGKVDGDLIDTWEDSSAGNHDLTSSGTSRPVYKTNILNGLPALRFDGINDYLHTSTLAGSTFFTANAATIFVVHRQNASGNGGPFVWLGTSNANAVGAYLANSSNDLVFDYGNQSAGGRVSVDQPSGWDDSFHISELYRSVGTGEITIDGTLLTTGSLTDDLDTAAVGQLDVGRRESVYTNGDIAEIIVFDRALTDSERSSIEQYLADKYGITTATGVHTADDLAQWRNPDGVVLAKVDRDGKVVFDAGAQLSSGAAAGKVLQSDAGGNFLWGNEPVHLTGNETVGGVKTFSASPVVPTPSGNSDAASKSYVDTAIANLVNTAPGVLDTLSELSTALGNDPNFATTITTSLAGKQPLDPTLTSLAAHNSNGILTQTAADTFTGRTITGTTNQVTVTNGDGVAGNPTLSLPQNIHTSASPSFAGMSLSGVLSVSTGVAAGTMFSLYNNAPSGATPLTTPLFKIHADNSTYDQWVANIENDGVMTALEINQNTALNFHENGLSVVSNANQTTIQQGFVIFWQKGTTSTDDLLELTNDGLGKTLLVNVNNDAYGYYGLKDFYNKAQTKGLIFSDWDARVNDGGTYAASGAHVFIRNKVTQTSGTITDSRVGLDVRQENTAGTGVSAYVEQRGTGHALSVKNTSTGRAVYIDQDGDAPSLYIDSAAAAQVPFFLSANNTSNSTFYVLSNAVHGTGTFGSLFRLQMANSSSSAPIFRVDNNGTGKDFDFDHDVTNTSWSGGAFLLQATSNVTNGATITKSGSIFQVISDVIETSGTVTDTAILMDLQQTHADATGAVLKIANSGSGASVALTNGGHISTDGTIGTKIGTATTQKLGFWNATPVVQSTGIADADGTLADITTKYNSLIAILESYGLLAVA